MKRAIFLITMTMTLSFATSAIAADRYKVRGTIKTYRVIENADGSAVLLARMDNDSNTFGIAAACAATPLDFVLDLTSPMAEEVMSIVMTAHISRIEVTIASPLAGEQRQCLEEASRLAYINIRA